MHARPPAGISLIELLVALVVAGILSALTVPGFSAYLRRERARGALNRLTAEIRHTQMLAVRNGARYQLRFRPATGCAASYQVVRAEDGAVARTVEVAREAAGVCLESNVANAFSFDSRGLLTGSARTVVARSGAQRDSLVVSIVGRVYRSD
jgi:prepilin-type N-terminal cleavage/methylation domain-containing protein